MKVTGNLLIIHGGGLVDPSKNILLRIADGISKLNVFDDVYLGKYSFISLYDSSLWIPYSTQLPKELEKTRGTFFGTCRGINLCNPDLMQKSLKTLENQNIKTVIVCGGDGSSRQCSAINDVFQAHGINIIFAVPLTVDGINGGCSIGIDQAVRESIRQTENVVATSLETRDNGEFSIVAVEFQGRNRDDILANALMYFYTQGKIADCKLDDIHLRVIPANYKTDEVKLLNEINTSHKRTLILCSEGATLKNSDLQRKTHRKVRNVTIGHATQSNGLTTAEDMEKYADWLNDVVAIIEQYPLNSYSIVNDGMSRRKEPINYYSKLNPRENQSATLSKELESILKAYMA